MSVENEKMIIKYVMRMLDNVDSDKLYTELGLLLKVFNKLPAYGWREIIEAVCGEDEGC